MPKLGVFNLVTMDGYFAGEKGDLSWHNTDPEFQKVAEKQSNSGSTLLFGRVTYELMKSYWPTPAALKDDPVVAKGMNNAPKIVFSRTLKNAEWNNTRLVTDDMVGAVKKLKQQSGSDMTILGSGTIVTQLTDADLIDHYQFLLNPVALGKGRTMFEGLQHRLKLKLTTTQRFSNGNVLLCYEKE